MRSVPDIISEIGQTNGRHPQRLFGIKLADRMYHQFIIGQTGTGKSTLLAQLMRQDSQHGVNYVLIDPHGDLAKAMTAELSVDHLYWDVADPDCPLGYNPITFVSPAYRPLLASGLISTLKKQWADAWGARMEHLLRFGLLALLECPKSSLRDVIPLFLNKRYRAGVLAQVTDPQVRQFWEMEYTAMNFKNAVDGVAPIANKLGAFLAHPVVRKAVCEPDEPIRFRRLMDNGTTLIVNLSKGKLGADVANVMGGMIISGLAHAAYTREDTLPHLRRPYMAYIDEFPTLTTAALSDIVGELRKFALSLCLVCQHTSNIDDSVFEAILGNVGTIISFRVGATDAAILSKQLAADVPQPRDLINLPNYQMFIKLMIDGNQSKPFSACTSLPPQRLDTNHSCNH